MPRIFGTGRGCFIAFTADVSKSAGVILTLPPDDDKIPDEARSLGLVVTDVGVQQNEVVSHLKCFNGGIYSYAFGNGVGDCSVKFMAFLKSGVKAGDTATAVGLDNGGSFAKVLELYSKARISRSKKYASLAVGSSGANIRGQVVALSADTNNTEGNIQAFMLSMRLTDVQGGIVKA